jgi:hypothetical protein
VIGQNGRWNSADTSQRGRHNIVGVGQFGSGHTAVATQDGSGNAVGVIQAGRNNHATSTQVGAGNVAVHSRPRNVAVDGPQAERREPLNEFARRCRTLAPRPRQTPAPHPTFFVSPFCAAFTTKRTRAGCDHKNPLLGCLLGFAFANRNCVCERRQVLRNKPVGVRSDSMANIHRPRSIVPTAAAGAALAGLLALACVAIAFWALWMMLEAAIDSDWLHVAAMVMLWTAAVGTIYLLVPPQGD